VLARLAPPTLTLPTLEPAAVANAVLELRSMLCNRDAICVFPVLTPTTLELVRDVPLVRSPLVLEPPVATLALAVTELTSLALTVSSVLPVSSLLETVLASCALVELTLPTLELVAATLAPLVTK
jgi:hypothetical protein